MKTRHQPTDWREGRRLRAWELHQQGWKQKDIATALGVTPGAVSQWMARGRAGTATLAQQLEMLVPRAVGSEKRREDGDDDERDEDDESDDRSRVTAQAIPRVAPEAAGRRLDRNFTGFELDDAHDNRIFGFKSP